MPDLGKGAWPHYSAVVSMISIVLTIFNIISVTLMLRVRVRVHPSWVRVVVRVRVNPS